jgi:crossover junction endodeoxyribonuclease RuvC
LHIPGFGIIDKIGNKLTYVSSGRIRTSPDHRLPPRLKQILDNLTRIISQYAPDHAAIEQVFVNINPKSTLLLGQARGAAICAAVQSGLEVSEYTALQIKQAVVGNGHARKEQVQEMVVRLLTLAGKPGIDASDALACAICHAHGGMGALSVLYHHLKRGRVV